MKKTTLTLCGYLFFTATLIANEKSNSWKPDPSFFSNYPKSIKTELNSYLQPSIAKSNISLKSAKLESIFSWWLNRLINPNERPVDKSKNNIKLLPSKNTGFSKDLATMSYIKNNKPFYIIQSGGTEGRLVIFTEIETELQSTNYKASALKVFTDITSDYVQSCSKKMNCYKLKTSNSYVLSDDKEDVRLFFKGSSVCVVFKKSRFYGVIPAHIPISENWFAFTDDKFKNKFDLLFPDSLYIISVNLPDAYSNFKTSFRLIFDKKDIRTTLDLIRSRKTISKTLSNRNLPQFYPAYEYEMDLHEALWKITLRVYNNTPKKANRQILLSEWNKALKEEPKFIAAQIKALRNEWNRDFLTPTLWESLKDNKVIEATEIVLKKHGTDNDRIRFNQIKTAQD